MYYILLHNNTGERNICKDVPVFSLAQLEGLPAKY
jgi:hypothetical protein